MRIRVSYHTYGINCIYGSETYLDFWRSGVVIDKLGIVEELLAVAFNGYITICEYSGRTEVRYRDKRRD